MNRNTLNRQLKAGIITQDRYDRMLDIIEFDEAHPELDKDNTRYIEEMILRGFQENKVQGF